MATKATTADLNTSTAKTTEVKEAPAKTTAEEVAVNKEANKKETAETETVKKETPSVLSKVLQMARQRLRVGLYFPASIRPMVWRVTPMASARSPWVISCSTRAIFNLRFFAT